MARYGHFTNERHWISFRYIWSRFPGRLCFMSESLIMVSLSSTGPRTQDLSPSKITSPWQEWLSEPHTEQVHWLHTGLGLFSVLVTVSVKSQRLTGINNEYQVHFECVNFVDWMNKWDVWHYAVYTMRLLYWDVPYVHCISPGFLWNAAWVYEGSSYLSFPSFQAELSADISFYFKTSSYSGVFLENLGKTDFIRLDMTCEL